MGEEYVHQLDTLLLKKTPRAQIATKIQEEWKQLTDIKHGTLLNLLNKYANEVLPMITGYEEVVGNETITGDVIPAGEDDPPKNGKKLKKFLDYRVPDDDFDVYQDMLTLMSVQKDRVDKLFGREQATPVLLKDLNKELQLLQGMYRDIAEFQFATGRLHKIPKSRIADMSTETEQKARKAFENKVKSQDQVSKASQKVLELLSKMSD